MNAFASLHELRRRIESALRRDPGYADWVVRGGASSEVCVALGREEAEMFRSACGCFETRPYTGPAGDRFMNFPVQYASRPSGVNISFKRSE